MSKSIPACFLLLLSLGGTAQFSGPRVYGQAETAPAKSVTGTQHAAIFIENRVTANHDPNRRIRLNGHLPIWVNSGNEIGEVPEAQTLYLTFVLSRSTEAEAAFDQLLFDQQNPTSTRYHQWLTPKQIGDKFGPTRADVTALTDWVMSQGLRIDEVTPSRQFVRVSGTIGEVEKALSLAFRYYRIPEMDSTGRYRSATDEPSIPLFLRPIVRSIAGLSELPEQPRPHFRPVAKETVSNDSPQLTRNNGEHLISPGDFAVIYNIGPVYNAGLHGEGQKIAIIGLSAVNDSVITNFENRVGLATKHPKLVPSTDIIPIQTGDDYQTEATLDVERVIGTAPGADVDLIATCLSQPPSSNCPIQDAHMGVFIDANYNVQTLLDPIMTISFAFCEEYASPSYATEFDTLFSQAAAEGISVFVSSGDSGVSGCAPHTMAPTSLATTASINLICSTGYVTCVGGNEFADAKDPSKYWSTNTTELTSALSYIPEGAWNEPVGSDPSVPYVVLATGGGPSAYIPKPSFQVGTGVPADGHRDTPDLSFSASIHDGYFGCNSTSQCVPDPNTGLFVPGSFYGTSAATPSMAGIAALFNQQIEGAQGNWNPMIYSMASTASEAFNDVTVESSGVADCTITVPSMCNNSTPGATALTGGLAGFQVNQGYDEATGWGSINVANFFQSAQKLSLIPTSPSIYFNYGWAQSSADTVTVTSIGGFNGAVQLTCTVNYIVSSAPGLSPSCLLSSQSLNLKVGGSSTISVGLSTAMGSVSHPSRLSRADKASELASTGFGILPFVVFAIPSVRIRPCLKKTNKRHSLFGLILLIITFLPLGCGGGRSQGYYLLTVTATGQNSGGYAITSNAVILVNVR